MIRSAATGGVVAACWRALASATVGAVVRAPPAGAGARPVHVDRTVDDDRLAPAAIGVDLPALECVEGSGTGLDAQPLDHGAPALAGMAVVLMDHVDAGDAQGVCDRARVVHVGRCTVASIEQVDQQRSRPAAVTVIIVIEWVRVITA